MDFKTVSEKKNPLLKRKEMILRLNYSGATPSKASLQQTFAKEFKTEPNRVEITKIITEIGKDSGTVSVKVWESKDIAIYGAKKEEAKPAEVPAEAK